MSDFRTINNFEKTIILNALKKITQESETLANEIQNRLCISFNSSILKNNLPLVYLLSNDLLSVMDDFPIDSQIIAAGLYFGFLKRKNFRLSIEGAEYLLHKGYIGRDKIIVVNDKGEKAILYGRAVNKDDLLVFPSKIKKGELLMVINSNKEICAISQSIIDDKDIEGIESMEKIATNLVDKGYYLRKKQ